MSYREPDFAGEIAQIVLQYKAYANATAELATITAALATDVTTHSKTIEEPPTALKIHHDLNTPFTNDINLVINKGKAGNLNVNQMISAIDDAVSVAHKPAIIDIPYAHAAATPPIVGTVCSVTNGNWTGLPTGYTYQWKRDGTTNLGTAASYTLIAADIGGHQITCVVTATNAVGSTAAPPSNAIAT